MHPSITTAASLHPPASPLCLWMLQVLPFKARGVIRQKWAEVGCVGQSRLVKKEALIVMEKGGGGGGGGGSAI